MSSIVIKILSASCDTLTLFPLFHKIILELIIKKEEKRKKEKKKKKTNQIHIIESNTNRVSSRLSNRLKKAGKKSDWLLQCHKRQVSQVENLEDSSSVSSRMCVSNSP